jgi:hypothetical protein
LNRLTLSAALRRLAGSPRSLLVGRWNWKAALTSSMVRGLIFLFANLSAGWRSAVAAMFAEWAFRALTSGFYGTITQTLGEVEPEWHGTVCAIFLLPVMSHSLEFVLHWLRHTPRLRTSLISSISFTIVSTLFNLYAMRRGTLVVGQNAPSLAADFRALPRMIVSFIVASGRGIGFLGRGLFRLPWRAVQDYDS